MISLDWIHFFRTGDFGGIRLCMLGQDLKKLLGKEEDYSVSKHPLILKFGRLQIALDENRVVSIAVYFRRETGPIWKEVKVTGWKASAAISLETFQDVLGREGIEASIMPTWTFEDRVGITLASGVSACFVREGKKSELDSVGLLDKEYGARRAVDRMTEIERAVESLKKQGEKPKGKAL